MHFPCQWQHISIKVLAFRNTRMSTGRYRAFMSPGKVCLVSSFWKMSSVIGEQAEALC